MDWYYMRLMITVTPSQVLHRPPMAAAEPLVAPPVARGEQDAYAETARRLPTYRSAVLCSLDDGGRSSLLRVRPTAHSAQRVLLVDGGGEPLRAGPASLLCHSHDEKLWNLRSMVCVGRLEQRDGGWAFIPIRFVPGAATEPLTLLRMIRQNRRNASAYLERRQQLGPEIPWGQYAAVKHGRSAAPAALLDRVGTVDGGDGSARRHRDIPPRRSRRRGDPDQRARPRVRRPARALGAGHDEPVRRQATSSRLKRSTSVWLIAAPDVHDRADPSQRAPVRPR